MNESATQSGVESRIEEILAQSETEQQERFEEPVLAQEPTPEPEQEPAETLEEVEDIEAESTDEADDSEVNAEDVQEDEGEALEVAQFAEIFGIDPEKVDVDEDGTPVFKTKVDGEEGQATLAKLIKSYQLEGHLNKANTEVQEQRKLLEDQQAELDKQVKSRVDQLDTLAQVAWSELGREYQSIDWQTLRTQDPAEFAALSQEYQQRSTQIQQLAQNIEAQRGEASQADQGRMQEFLQDQGKKLLNAIPEWKDTTVAEKEQADIRKYMIGHNFTQDEVNQVADHRHVLMVRKAMMFDRLQDENPAVTKRVRKAPKLVKAGRAKDKAERDETSLKKVKSRMHATGHKTDVANFLLASGKIK